MTDIDIPCLSLRDPWCWCVESLEKGIENRKVNTHRRGLFAIHLALGCTAKEESGILSQIRGFGFDPKDWPGRKNRPRGAIVALSTILDVIPPHAPDGDARIMAHGQDPRWWFPEQYGFVLGKVIKLAAPLPAVGALGFFSLTNPVGMFETPRMSPARYQCLVKIAREYGLAA
jgi:hypothetical protein